ncbi:acyl carrier protein [Actinokineospora soli]|uniref:Acyl carrier protein n=1 Tax=Actinokineospora soli TaxID=1048753 RepID=A0ABW2TTT7_9PSEU
MSDPRTIKEFIVEEFAPDVDVERLADDQDLIAAGIIDSLGLLRLVTWLGSHYDIPIDDVDIAESDFVTVEAICRFVEREAPVAAQQKGGWV